LRDILNLFMTELVIAALVLQSPASVAQVMQDTQAQEKLVEQQAKAKAALEAAQAQGMTDGARPFDLEVDVPARNTIIEFNPSSGAVSYQVQIRANNRFWAHNYQFDIAGDQPKLRIRLNPGEYSLRTRSFDANGYYGPWSGWQKFWIHYDSVNSIYPADGSTVKPKSGVREMLMFEWPIDTKAVGYRFILKDKDGNTMRLENVRTPWNLVELELSSKYSWLVTPLYSANDYKKTPADVPDLETTFYQFRVAGSAPGTRDMEVRATESPRAIKYQFEFLKLDRMGERGSSSVFESVTPEFKIAIAPGTYEARVRTFFNDNSISDWSPPWQFFVPYEKVKTIAPYDNELIDPVDFETPVELSWHPQVDVNHYVVYIYKENGDFVRSYKTEETNLIARFTHQKNFRWLVIPYSAGQSDIKPPEMPEDAPRVRVAQYIPLLMTASEEPSHLYGWGRYYGSMINYEGRNYDLNSKVSQPIFGGSGELALGYWHRKTHFGALIHGGLSGFTLQDNGEGESTTHNYANAGLHLGYRHFMDNGDRLRLWLGYTYMEFPEFVVDPFLKVFDYHRIKTGGPQFQISYMGDFKKYPDYGWHAYGTIFQSRQNFQTPNDLEAVPRLSFTVGFFGTYKWSEDQKWMLGYAYRQENIQYKSNDRTGLDNYSTTSGHYLNLSIEIGLAKQKYK